MRKPNVPTVRSSRARRSTTRSMLRQSNGRRPPCTGRPRPGRRRVINAGAVQDFLRVAAVAPASPIRAKAEFDAATLLLQDQQWTSAATVLEGFRATYPAHELAADVDRKLAVAYVESGQQAKAAGEFERVAARETEEPEVRRTALWQAADLQLAAGDRAAAARVYAEYVNAVSGAGGTGARCTTDARGPGARRQRPRGSQALARGHHRRGSRRGQRAHGPHEVPGGNRGTGTGTSARPRGARHPAGPAAGKIVRREAQGARGRARRLWPRRGVRRGAGHDCVRVRDGGPLP